MGALKPAGPQRSAWLAQRGSAASSAQSCTARLWQAASSFGMHVG